MSGRFACPIFNFRIELKSDFQNHLDYILYEL